MFLAITSNKGLLKTTIAAALKPTTLTSVPPNSDLSSVSHVSIPGPQGPKQEGCTATFNYLTQVPSTGECEGYGAVLGCEVMG